MLWAKLAAFPQNYCGALPVAEKGRLILDSDLFLCMARCWPVSTFEYRSGLVGFERETDLNASGSWQKITDCHPAPLVRSRSSVSPGLNSACMASQQEPDPELPLVIERQSSPELMKSSIRPDITTR